VTQPTDLEHPCGCSVLAGSNGKSGIASSTAKQVLDAARAPAPAAAIDVAPARPHAVSGREWRWWWFTDLPFVGCALAVLAWLPAQPGLSPLLCIALVLGFALSCNVCIALHDSGYAASVQLVFVPMLFLAPLNLVPLMVLTAYLVQDVVLYVRTGRPLARAVLAPGNCWWALGPVLVLAIADVGTFTWDQWLVVAIALAAQLVLGGLVAFGRARLHDGEWLPSRDAVVPTVIDLALTLPALAVVAVAGQAPVAAVLITLALLVIAGGFTSQRSGRLVDRERAADSASRALMDERLRIARELHDVVAHHVSLMGVQAGAARVVLARDPAKAAQALMSIESSSRRAVFELHQLLAFLRQSGDVDDLSPQPGLDQLQALADAMSGSQLIVDVHVDGEQRALPPTMDVSAYRIVQEALTNTLKHSGASRASVDVRYRPGELGIEITDNGSGKSTPSSLPGGLGLIGMRERAVLHGGTLTAGSVEGGGFAVRVTLPTPAGALG